MILVEHFHNDTWVNINDFVTGASKVPYIDRNRDFSLSAVQMDLEISAAIGYGFSHGDKIRISIDDAAVFGGFVKKNLFSSSNQLWKLQLENNLMYLKKYLVDFGTLKNDLLTASAGDPFKYNPSDSYGYPNVNILFLMQRMFAIAGLTLDISGVENEIAIASDIYNVCYKHFTLDEGMLYALNCPVATYYNEIDSKHKFEKINFFELFSEFCSAFGFCVIITAPDTYKLFKPGGNYVISDDDKYDYDSETVLADYDNACLSVWLAGYYGSQSIFRAYYYKVYYDLQHIADPNAKKETNLVQANYDFPIGESKNEIHWLNNLCYFTYGYYSGAFHPDASVIWMPTDQIDKPALNRYREMTADYQREEITTDIITEPRAVIRNHIDLEHLTSQIIQETFL